MAELRLQQQQHHQHEFLPLCDVLFNIISLASYFCDVVFDLAMAYALAHHSEVPPVLFPFSVVLVVTSLIVSQVFCRLFYNIRWQSNDFYHDCELLLQIISVKWYLWGARGKLRNNTANSDCDINGGKKTANWTLGCVLLLHSTQLGVLWRYFKLFIPVDLTYVKHEVS